MIKRLFILIILMAGIASAETGNVTVTDQSILSYTINDGMGTAGSVMNQIYLDTTNYNTWESFHINLSLQSPIFALDSETTQFTCSAGGTCSGYVWYVKEYKKVYFAFTSLSVTSSPITLSYTKNILANITGMTRTKNDCIPSITQPVLLYKETVVTPRCLGGLYESVTVDSSTTDQYVVTYPFSNAFTLNVTKGQSVNDQWVVYDVDGNIYMTGTMDKKNFALTNNSYNGIIANVSMATGASTIVYINVSGFPGFTPAPTPTVNPLTGVGIIFDASSYLVGATANISWIRSGSIPFGSVDKIILKSPDDASTEIVSNPVDTGSYKVVISQIGTYSVNYTRTGLFGLGTTETLESDTAEVTNKNPSYILSNASVPAGLPFNVTYLFGYTPPIQGELNAIRIDRIDLNDITYWSTVSLNNTNIAANTEYNLSLTIGALGKYKLSLFDISNGFVAYTIVDTVDTTIPPERNITTSYIQTDLDTYFKGDFAQISYGIDNTNYSNYPEKYIRIIQSSGAYPETGRQLLTRQEDIITQEITEQSTWFKWFAGVNYVELHAKNATSDILLANTSFTLSFIDLDGYGLEVTPVTVCTGEFINIKTSAPISSRLDVTVYQKNVNSLPIIYFETTVNRSNKTMPLKLAMEGDYFINLYDSNGDSRFVKKVTASKGDCEEVVVTVTPPTAGQKTTEITNVLTSNLFWALVFTVGIMGFIGFKTKDGLPTSIAGMTSLGVFTWMTWVPPALFFSVLVIAAGVYLAPGIAAKILNIGGTQK